MKKKIFRIIGYVFCGILMLLCILLIISASVFGSKRTVDIFGVNIYIVENDDIASTPAGGAVLVQKGAAADLDPGKLVLYLKADADDAPTLGYVTDIAARDGIHYITVSYKDEPYEFTESKLIGRADYYSKFWGGAIRFIRTPLGIMVIAVLPCAALILYDIIRAAAANRPEPEVVPKVKNADDEQPHTDIRLAVDTEGKALYSKDRSLQTLPKDSSALYGYSGRQKETGKGSSRSERPIIPLTDKKPKPAPAESRPQAEPKTEVRDKTGKIFDIKMPSDTAEADSDVKRPASGTDTRLSSPAETAPERPTPGSEKPKRESVPVKTAEIPVIAGKQTSGDAFFAQPSAGRSGIPQIGRQRRVQVSAEDDESESRSTYPRSEKPAGKRSTQILASKSYDDLLSDDDDLAYSKDFNDRAVDDILASINNRKFE